MAVRSALAAGGAQLLRYFLLESLLLAGVGGLVGVALATVGVRSLLALGQGSIPRLAEVAVDAPVIALAVGMAAASGFVLALVPMLRVRSRGVVASMRDGLRGAPGTALQYRVRSALVVTQVSLALVLLVGSGLMLRSFGALLNVDSGVDDPEQVVTFRVTVPENEIGDAAGVARTYEELAARFGELGGVASVGISSSLTMEGLAYDEPLQLEDEPRRPDEEPIRVRVKSVGGGYFETMGVPLVAGRAIDWTDVRDGARIVVVTRGFAEQHWGGAESALGRRIARGEMESTFGSLAGGRQWLEVVGVAEDVRDDGLDRPPHNVAYFPLPSSGLFVAREMSFALRTSRPSPAALHSEIRAAAAEVNPNLPISAEGTLDGLLAASMSRTTFTLFALLVAGAVALSLGIVGLYGVVSYAVSQRTREIGVRIALGADSGDVSGLVVTEGATLAGLGVAIGLVAAAALTRLMASLLHGVEPTDPATFATVGALLMSVAIAASYMPARRAARMNPLQALRTE